MNIFKQNLKRIYREKRLHEYCLIMLIVNSIRKLQEIIKYTKAIINLIILKINSTQKCRSNPEKINVVFLYQMPELWNKLEPIYNELMRRKEFNVIILVIPQMDINCEDGVVGSKVLDNDALKFTDHFNCKVIDARVSESEWYDLRSLRPDYVFYQRPYDIHLPYIYRSYNVIKYAKTCYIPYGYLLTTTNEKICTNKQFFRNLYLFYAENMDNAKRIRKRTLISHVLNLRKTLFLGYPSLESVLKLKKIKEQKYDKDISKIKVIWTPRWTTDDQLCSSNFFEYKDNFTEFVKKNEDIYVLFRPHPLAFKNYLDTGLMSEGEIDEYKNKVNQFKNASMDTQKDYLATFWKSDILVTDISSIIIEYFITGKPIIYCDNGTANLNKFATKMSEGFYWAKNWDEVEFIIMKIKNGKDTLYHKRQELIKELFGEQIENSSQRIVESLLKDYKC